MKKILSLLLCVIMLIGVFSGCSQQPSEPNDDKWYVIGTYIRLTNGQNMIVSKESGPIVMSGMVDEFRALQSGSEVKIQTGPIMESYPAQGTVYSVELIQEKPLNIYDEKYATLIEMGWYPTQLNVMQDPDENYVIYSGEIKQTFKNCYKFDEESELLLVLSNVDNLTYEDVKGVAKDAVVLFQYDKKTMPSMPNIEYKENYEAMSKILDAIDKSENVIYSPLSFNIAMGMLANGVSEDLQKPFEEYYGFTTEEYNKFAQYYLSLNDGVTEHANSIWVKKNFVLNEQFQKTVKEYFDAECENVEFNQEFIERLNNWCKEKTHDLIPKILDNPPDENHKCFLVNALYFNGQWTEEYSKNSVRDTEFTTKDNQKVTVTGMFGEENTYFENENAKAFAKPYKGNKYMFVGILPKEEGDFTFADLDIESLLASKSYEEVQTMLPKFKFDNSNTMTDILDEVGLGGLKIEGSLPNIIENEDDLFVSMILQKAIIDVNEKGTEAAAVTIVGVTDSCAPIQKEPKTVYLNRPFAFLIYDVENNVVLFAGKVVQPNA